MVMKYPGTESYQTKRKKYPLKVTLSTYKQQWKVNHNGNHFATIKQVSKNPRNTFIFAAFYLSEHHTLPPNVYFKVI